MAIDSISGLAGGPTPSPGLSTKSTTDIAAPASEVTPAPSENADAVQVRIGPVPRPEKPFDVTAYAPKSVSKKSVGL